MSSIHRDALAGVFSICTVPAALLTTAISSLLSANRGRLDCYVLCPTPSYIRKPSEQMTSLRSYLRFVQPHCALGVLETVRTWKSNRMIYLTPRSGRFDLPEIVIAKPTWSFTLFCSRNGRITLAGLFITLRNLEVNYLFLEL